MFHASFSEVGAIRHHFNFVNYMNVHILYIMFSAFVDYVNKKYE